MESLIWQWLAVVWWQWQWLPGMYLKPSRRGSLLSAHRSCVHMGLEQIITVSFFSLTFHYLISDIGKVMGSIKQ